MQDRANEGWGVWSFLEQVYDHTWSKVKKEEKKSKNKKASGATGNRGKSFPLSFFFNLLSALHVRHLQPEHASQASVAH